MTIESERIRRFVGLLVVLMLAGTGCESVRERITERNDTNRPAPQQSVHLFFGNPSSAKENDPDNYLIVSEGSVISYNNSRGTPNWASWRTLKTDLGPSLKRPEFRPDPRLPAWFARINYTDYSGSGYDRGHLVPSADRFANEVLNEETFFLTNIVPQTSELNRYPWEKLESYARGQARRGFEVHQIAGVYGSKEMLNGKVTVPTNCWKIMAILPPGETAASARYIAVDMPNTAGIEQTGWQNFKTSIRAIEEKTGYDFMRTLPRELQDKLETRTEIGSP
jgi:endonuclease G, mitochondrial